MDSKIAAALLGAVTTAALDTALLGKADASALAALLSTVDGLDTPLDVDTKIANALLGLATEAFVAAQLASRDASITALQASKADATLLASYATNAALSASETALQSALDAILAELAALQLSGSGVVNAPAWAGFTTWELLRESSVVRNLHFVAPLSVALANGDDTLSITADCYSVAAADAALAAALLAYYTSSQVDTLLGDYRTGTAQDAETTGAITAALQVDALLGDYRTASAQDTQTPAAIAGALLAYRTGPDQDVFTTNQILGAGGVPLSRRPGHGDGLEHRRRPAQLLHHRTSRRPPCGQARSHGGGLCVADSSALSGRRRGRRGGGRHRRADPGPHGRLAVKLDGSPQQRLQRGPGHAHRGSKRGRLHPDVGGERVEHRAHLQLDARQRAALRLPLPARHGLQLRGAHVRGRQRLRPLVRQLRGRPGRLEHGQDVLHSAAQRSGEAALRGALLGAGPAQPNGWNGGRLRPPDPGRNSGDRQHGGGGHGGLGTAAEARVPRRRGRRRHAGHPGRGAAGTHTHHARKFPGALQQPELRGLGQLHGGRLPAGGLRHDPERLRLEHRPHLHADAGETLLLRLPVPAGHGLQLGDVRQRGRQRLRGRHRHFPRHALAGSVEHGAPGLNREAALRSLRRVHPRAGAAVGGHAGPVQHADQGQRLRGRVCLSDGPAGGLAGPHGLGHAGRAHRAGQRGLRPAAVQRRELHRRVHHGRGRLGRHFLRCAHSHRHRRRGRAVVHGGCVRQLAEHQRRGQRGPAELRHGNHGQHTHHQQHGQRRERGRRVHGHADGLGRSNRGELRSHRRAHGRHADDHRCGLHGPAGLREPGLHLHGHERRSVDGQRGLRRRDELGHGLRAAALRVQHAHRDQHLRLLGRSLPDEELGGLEQAASVQQQRGPRQRPGAAAAGQPEREGLPGAGRRDAPVRADHDQRRGAGADEEPLHAAVPDHEPEEPRLLAGNTGNVVCNTSFTDSEIAEADVAELLQLFDSVEAKQYKRPDMNGDLRLGFASDDFAGTKWKNLTGTTRWSDGTEMVTLDYSHPGCARASRPGWTRWKPGRRSGGSWPALTSSSKMGRACLQPMLW